MYPLGLRAAVLGAILIMTAGDSTADDRVAPLKYPEPPRSETVDDYHGRKIADPYRPLEDPDSPATRAWVEAENRVTFAFLESIPQRAAIRKRLTALWDYEKYSPPRQEGGRYFFSYNTGLQNQSVLYTAESIDGPSRILLDPNTLSADGTVALAGVSPSKDGRRLAYGIAAAGSDWNEWKVRDVATGQDTPDVLRWVKFSDADWLPDGGGFYYGRFPEPQPGDDLKGANYNQKVYLHRVGTPQSADILVWEDPEHKDWRAMPRVTDDGRYLLLTLEKGTDAKYRVLYRPLDQPDARPSTWLATSRRSTNSSTIEGPVFWFKTNKDAPRGKGRGDRHPQPRAGELGRADPPGRGDARACHRGRRPLPGRLSQGCPLGRPGPRPRWAARPRRRVPRARHSVRVRRQTNR